jgi:excisionase family DNA binding protein
MKVEVELSQADRQAIAREVLELLKPLLNGNGREPEDKLLTPEELAELLNVKKAQIYAWVGESRYSDDGIPFMKAGKFLRFSRKAVFTWMDQEKSR